MFIIMVIIILWSSVDVGYSSLSEAFFTAVLAMGLCLSQVGVLLKRLNVGSHKQHHTIAQGL